MARCTVTKAGKNIEFDVNHDNVNEIVDKKINELYAETKNENKSKQINNIKNKIKDDIIRNIISGNKNIHITINDENEVIDNTTNLATFDALLSSIKASRDSFVNQRGRVINESEVKAINKLSELYSLVDRIFEARLKNEKLEEEGKNLREKITSKLAEIYELTSTSKFSKDKENLYKLTLLNTIHKVLSTSNEILGNNSIGEVKVENKIITTNTIANEMNILLEGMLKNIFKKNYKIANRVPSDEIKYEDGTTRDVVDEAWDIFIEQSSRNPTLIDAFFGIADSISTPFKEAYLFKMLFNNILSQFYSMKEELFDNLGMNNVLNIDNLIKENKTGEKFTHNGNVKSAIKHVNYNAVIESIMEKHESGITNEEKFNVINIDDLISFLEKKEFNLEHINKIKNSIINKLKSVNEQYKSNIIGDSNNTYKLSEDSSLSDMQKLAIAISLYPHIVKANIAALTTKTKYGIDVSNYNTGLAVSRSDINNLDFISDSKDAEKYILLSYSITSANMIVPPTLSTNVFAIPYGTKQVMEQSKLSNILSALKDEVRSSISKYATNINDVIGRRKVSTVKQVIDNVEQMYNKLYQYDINNNTNLASTFLKQAFGVDTLDSAKAKIYNNYSFEEAFNNIIDVAVRNLVRPIIQSMKVVDSMTKEDAANKSVLTTIELDILEDMDTDMLKFMCSRTSVKFNEKDIRKTVNEIHNKIITRVINKAISPAQRMTFGILGIFDGRMRMFYMMLKHIKKVVDESYKTKSSKHNFVTNLAKYINGDTEGIDSKELENIRKITQKIIDASSFYEVVSALSALRVMQSMTRMFYLGYNPMSATTNYLAGQLDNLKLFSLLDLDENSLNIFRRFTLKKRKNSKYYKLHQKAKNIGLRYNLFHNFGKFEYEEKTDKSLYTTMVFNNRVEQDIQADIVYAMMNSIKYYVYDKGGKVYVLSSKPTAVENIDELANKFGIEKSAISTMSIFNMLDDQGRPKKGIGYAKIEDGKIVFEDSMPTILTRTMFLEDENSYGLGNILAEIPEAINFSQGFYDWESDAFFGDSKNIVIFIRSLFYTLSRYKTAKFQRFLAPPSISATGHARVGILNQDPLGIAIAGGMHFLLTTTMSIFNPLQAGASIVTSAMLDKATGDSLVGSITKYIVRSFLLAPVSLGYFINSVVKNRTSYKLFDENIKSYKSLTKANLMMLVDSFGYLFSSMSGKGYKFTNIEKELAKVFDKYSVQYNALLNAKKQTAADLASLYITSGTLAVNTLLITLLSKIQCEDEKDELCLMFKNTALYFESLFLKILLSLNTDDNIITGNINDVVDNFTGNVVTKDIIGTGEYLYEKLTEDNIYPTMKKSYRNSLPSLIRVAYGLIRTMTLSEKDNVTDISLLRLPDFQQNIRKYMLGVSELTSYNDLKKLLSELRKLKSIDSSITNNQINVLTWLAMFTYADINRYSKNIHKSLVSELLRETHFSVVVDESEMTISRYRDVLKKKYDADLINKLNNIDALEEFLNGRVKADLIDYVSKEDNAYELYNMLKSRYFKLLDSGDYASKHALINSVQDKIELLERTGKVNVDKLEEIKKDLEVLRTDNTTSGYEYSKFYDLSTFMIQDDYSSGKIARPGDLEKIISLINNE